MRRGAALTLGVVLGVVVLAVALLWVFQREFYYFPDSGPVPLAASVLPDAREVTLRTTDAIELGAWYVPAAGRRDTGPTVLVASGNAGNRSNRATLARALSEAGFAVLLFDYRGYGANPGSPSEDGLKRDVRAAYRFLTVERGVPPERLLYFGESIGAAVVAELATEHPPGGLLLRSPFVDLATAGRVHYPWLPVGLLLRDRYPVTTYVRDIEVPTTVVYGTDDAVVPPEQSRRVGKLAGTSTELLEVVAIDGAGHNDPVMFGGDDVIDAVKRLATRMGR